MTTDGSTDHVGTGALARSGRAQLGGSATIRINDFIEDYARGTALSLRVVR